MNKKQTNKKDINKKKLEKDKRANLPWVKIAIFLSCVLTVVISYYACNVLTAPAAIPNINLNEWWGQYPMNPKQDLSIRPYKIEFSDVIVNDLRDRLLHRRPFQPPLEGTGFTYGFNTKFLEQVIDYWKNRYDFKDRENYLNKYNHYLTNIQGLDIHFIHIKPQVTPDVKVLPLLLLHGWPSSVLEFYELIPKLTKQRDAHNFVFEIIAPSIPGFGFSQAPSRPGLGPLEVAVIMQNLMQHIGHPYYYVHGTDWGHVIGTNMATLFPDQVLGFHTSSPVIILHPLATIYTLLGSLWPSAVVEKQFESRMYPLSEKLAFSIEESGYLHLQATKPDTIGVALTDSPVGLATYILEKFSTWTNPEYRIARDGNLVNKFALTILLDNVMIYWVTNTITTSMRMYAEGMSRKQMAYKMDQIPTSVPTWGIKFKHELMYQPDFILKLKYTNYLHSTVVEDGGHFAALELPDIMADDIFQAADTFLQFHSQSNQKTKTAKLQKTIYDFTVKDIKGNEVKLDRYKGHVLLIVNVASHCGLTDTNYNQLNELYEKYKSKGLKILAFPCNQFGGQEPGSPKEILDFTKNRGVKFDLFEKVDVNGDDAHPLWQYLKSAQGGSIGDFIKWNFSKFIVDKNGIAVERFAPTTSPKDLEPYLIKYL